MKHRSLSLEKIRPRRVHDSLLYKSGMKLSPQALWKRVAAALYACQVGSARVQHLCFMSVTDGQFLSLTV